MVKAERDGPRPKKQKRLSYEKEQRIAELEGLLFGKTPAGMDRFSTEQELDFHAPAMLIAAQEQAEADGATVTEAPLFIFEDRRGARAARFSDDDEDVGDEAAHVTRSGDDEDDEGPDVVPISSGRPGGSAGRSVGPGRSAGSDDENEDEDDEGSEPDEQPIGKGPSVLADLSDDDDDDGDTEGARRGPRQRDGWATRTRAGGGARPPVWVDPDDAAVNVNVAARDRLRKLRKSEGEAQLSGRDYEDRLRALHARMNPRTSWAAPPLERSRAKAVQFGESSDEEDAAEAEGLLKSAGRLLGSSEALPPGLIHTTRLKDANVAEPNKAVVQSVEFHPQGHLMLTAGLDRRLRFFRVDGVKNPLVQSIFFEDMPVHKAAFANGGSQVIAAGRRKFFYLFDLAASRVERIPYIAGRQEKSFESFAVSPTATDNPVVAFFGNQGFVPLVSLKTRQAVGELKMSGSARTAVFSADGLQLVTAGGGGVMHTWDMRTRRCLRREVDEGCVNSSALALSRDGGFLAAGSDAGVVNIYSRDRGMNKEVASLPSPAAMLPIPAAKISPLKAVMNLTTTIDSLAFSPDSQILAMGSRMKRDALRLVHIPSFTVFSNWPTSRSPLQYVHSLAFSPGGGLLAVGNARGRVVLYRLHHYASF